MKKKWTFDVINFSSWPAEQFLESALSIDPVGEFSFYERFDFYGCNDRRVKKE